MQVLDVHPEARERLAGRALALRDLVLVVREDQIDAAGVDVDRRLAEQPQRHRRALDVPARAARARSPRSHVGSPGLVAFHSTKSRASSFVVVVGVDARAGLHAVVIEARQLAVVGQRRDLEVDRAVAAVGVAVARRAPRSCRPSPAGSPRRSRAAFSSTGSRPSAARVLAERGDVLVGVLAQRHAGLLRAGDRPVVDVGEVHHVAHVDSRPGTSSVAAQHVDADEGAEVADVAARVDGQAARVHPHGVVARRARTPPRGGSACCRGASVIERVDGQRVGRHYGRRCTRRSRAARRSDVGRRSAPRSRSAVGCRRGPLERDPRSAAPAAAALSSAAPARRRRPSALAAAALERQPRSPRPRRATNRSTSSPCAGQDDRERRRHRAATATLILQRKAIEQRARAARSRRRSARAAASTPSNARSSRRRCTKPTRSGAPYRSRSRSKMCVSIVGAVRRRRTVGRDADVGDRRVHDAVDRARSSRRRRAAAAARCRCSRLAVGNPIVAAAAVALRRPCRR